MDSKQKTRLLSRDPDSTTEYRLVLLYTTRERLIVLSIHKIRDHIVLSLSAVYLLFLSVSPSSSRQSGETSACALVERRELYMSCWYSNAISSKL